MVGKIVIESDSDDEPVKQMAPAKHAAPQDSDNDSDNLNADFDSADSEEEDVPLARRKSSARSSAASSPVVSRKPVAAMKKMDAKTAGGNGGSKTKSKVVDDSDSEADDDDDEDVPLAKKVSKNGSRDAVDKKAKKSASLSKNGSSDSVSAASKQKKKSNGSSEGVSKKSKELSDSEDEDIPLAKKIKAKKNGSRESGASSTSKKPKRTAVDEDSDSDEDVPLAKKVSKKKLASSDSDEDEPLAKKLKTKKEPKPVKAKKRTGESDDDDENVPLAKKLKKTPASPRKPKKASESPKKKSKEESSPKKEGEEEETAVYKWWEEANLDGSVKWTTLSHNGVYFPPEYVPHGVKMKYEGKEVTLSSASEEVAGFFAALLETPFAENATFRKNFFNDFLLVLKEHDPVLEKCDFTPMFEHFNRLKEAKKNMTKEEKEEIKRQKKEIDDYYGWAIIDGRKEKVGNFRIEPPGLFRGRGDHPKTGTLKRRLVPEDITINLGKEAPVPDAPKGHIWGGIAHDNTVAWLATWTENIQNNIKYVLFAATSSLKGMSDFKKFEKARELKKLIGGIRRDYTADLKDKVMSTRQRATALWLIDRLALRAGNEKGDDEADTVGCCSLRFEHIELQEEDATVPDLDDPSKTRTISRKIVVFDFLGKDSIRYYNRVEVDPVVWKNLGIFKRPPKKEGDPLFDRLSTTVVNKHLNSLMAGLSAKVFRTHNASSTFQEELKKTPVDGSISDKILSYNRANRQVAILCNHQRAVTKGHGAQMEKIDEKILAMKYERHCVKKALLAADPKLKKSRKDLAEPESDMDDETIERKHQDHIEAETEKLEKKWLKQCEKAEAEGTEKPEKPEFEEKVLDVNVEKLMKKLETITSRIDHAKTMRIDKDENKTTALGTSKINYIDPRITAAWCAKYDVPIDKMFTKSLRDKFQWAMEVDEDWSF